MLRGLKGGLQTGLRGFQRFLEVLYFFFLGGGSVVFGFSSGF